MASSQRQLTEQNLKELAKIGITFDKTPTKKTQPRVTALAPNFPTPNQQIASRYDAFNSKSNQAGEQRFKMIQQMDPKFVTTINELKSTKEVYDFYDLPLGPSDNELRGKLDQGKKFVFTLDPDWGDITSGGVKKKNTLAVFVYTVSEGTKVQVDKENLKNLQRIYELRAIQKSKPNSAQTEKDPELKRMENKRNKLMKNLESTHKRIINNSNLYFLEIETKNLKRKPSKQSQRDLAQEISFRKALLYDIKSFFKPRTGLKTPTFKNKIE